MWLVDIFILAIPELYQHDLMFKIKLICSLSIIELFNLTKICTLRVGIFNFFKVNLNQRIQSIYTVKNYYKIQYR